MSESDSTFPPVRLIVARCEVRYTGRLTAVLPESKRLLIFKSDGSVLIHADAGGYKPLNWMTPPTAIEDDGDRIVVRKRAGKTEDCLEVRLIEVLAGGSIYWIIRGQIRVRQLVTRFSRECDENGRRYCRIEIDERLVPTLPRPWRPFQGWRYLSSADAPEDCREAGEPPSDRLLAELRALGLI